MKKGTRSPDPKGNRTRPYAQAIGRNAVDGRGFYLYHGAVEEAEKAGESTMTRDGIVAELFRLQDKDYALLKAKIIPAVPADRIIGVRTPALRALARRLYNGKDTEAFLSCLPHPYFDEDQLHAFVISLEKDFGKCVAEVDAFLPFVDNWATCDMMNPKCLSKRLPELLPHARRWMESEHPYTCRFGIGLLMRWYLGDAFEPRYLDWAAAVPAGHYYVHMMVAWYFATALTKQYDAALPYLTAHRLDRRTHNKAIQKACESYCIPPERKEELRGLRGDALSSEAKKAAKKPTGKSEQ